MRQNYYTKYVPLCQPKKSNFLKLCDFVRFSAGKRLRLFFEVFPYTGDRKSCLFARENSAGVCQNLFEICKNIKSCIWGIEKV